jgi:hypothetical protein
MVFQTPANLPVLYPVGSLEEILYICGVGPEAVCEGLRLVVPDGIAPKLYCQFFDNFPRRSVWWHCWMPSCQFLTDEADASIGLLNSS